MEVFLCEGVSVFARRSVGDASTASAGPRAVLVLQDQQRHTRFFFFTMDEIIEIRESGGPTRSTTTRNWIKPLETLGREGARAIGMGARTE